MSRSALLGNEPVVETPTRASWDTRSMRQSTIVEYQSDDEEPWQNESLLRELYLNQELSTYEIADELNCHPSTVQEWIREFGIPTRGPNGTDPNAEYKDESFLQMEYADKERSAHDIAEDVGVAPNTIYTWLEKHGIERRCAASEVDESAPYTDENWLRKKYQEEGMSSIEMGGIAGVRAATIRTWLHRYDIEVDDEGRNPLPYASFYIDSNCYEAWRGWTPDENKQEHVMVHRLLAVAYHGMDAVNGMHVHHKNGIKWDNRIENLELKEPKEHARYHGLKNDHSRDKQGRFK